MNRKQACLATPGSVGRRGARRWPAERLAVLCLGVLLAACQMRISSAAEPPTQPEMTSDEPAAEQPARAPDPLVDAELPTVTVEPTRLYVSEGATATYLLGIIYEVTKGDRAGRAAPASAPPLLNRV